MQPLSRRRFLTIAACAGVFAPGASAAAGVTQWRETALGAQVTLTLAHADAETIAERVFAELRRLEAVFSLYRDDTALVALNRDGHLPAPPFELLECLGLCGRVHSATGGAFDPTVQPLWQAHARQLTYGAPDPEGIEQARALVGWQGVAFDSGSVRLAHPGMALTLNGIAQGYIADRVAAMLRREGLSEVMVDTGELQALGGHPGGGDWPVTLQAPDGGVLGRAGLRDAALATSAPAGMRLGGTGPGHILNPATGQPTEARWRLVSVTGPSAALADALSTAFCVMDDRAAMEQALAAFPGMGLMHLS